MLDVRKRSFDTRTTENSHLTPTMERALIIIFIRSLILMSAMVYFNFSWFEAYAAAVVHDGVSLLLLRLTSF
jgi:hypothetical protein